MTDQNITFRPGSNIGDVVSFPVGAELPASIAPFEKMRPAPDGMPCDFSLNDDGIYQLRPGDGEDLLPIRICSPLIVKGICSRPNGGGWGRVVAV